MLEVTKEQFFERIGPLNVHPAPVGRWEDLGGYKILWKLSTGELVGVSEPKSYDSFEKKYFLCVKEA